MAKFLANTRIEHGVAGDDGVQEKVVVFDEGDEVKGLDKEVMAQLWDAGSLRMVDGDAKDPRIEAARHASYTGEGVNNELTNPDKADQKATSKSSTGTSATTPPKGATGTGRASA
jgi:hypothetical protein